MRPSMQYACAAEHADRNTPRATSRKTSCTHACKCMHGLCTCMDDHIPCMQVAHAAMAQHACCMRPCINIHATCGYAQGLAALCDWPVHAAMHMACMHMHTDCAHMHVACTHMHVACAHMHAACTWGHASSSIQLCMRPRTRLTHAADCTCRHAHGLRTPMHAGYACSHACGL